MEVKRGTRRGGRNTWIVVVAPAWVTVAVEKPRIRSMVCVAVGRTEEHMLQNHKNQQSG